MTTLTTFLLERIAEDEAVAIAATGAPWTERDASHEPPHAKGTSNVEGEPWTVASVVNTTDALHITRWDPTRILAECQAKRRILEQHVENESRATVYRSPRWLDAMNDDDRLSWRKAEARCAATDGVVRALAQVYSDHPDYDPTWNA